MKWRKVMKQIKDTILKPEEKAKLDKWKARLENARLSYADEINRMGRRDDYYNGSRVVNRNPNDGGTASKLAINVRNIVYELIESQIDSSIPAPKIIPIHAEDEEAARNIEIFLQNEIQRLRMHEINDINERTTYIQGGDFLHVEWDSRKGYHCNIGDLTISERHPRQVIPQPGVSDISKMDYIIVQYNWTKEFVQRKYGVDVSLAEKEQPFSKEEEKALANDLVTVNTAYYRGKNGCIGLFVWCDDYILEDLEDYQSRRIEVCTKCGERKTDDVCSCGNKKFKEVIQEFETLTEDIITFSGIKINSKTEREVFAEGENGVYVTSELKETKIPYYNPRVFPLVVRRNVSRNGALLGFSDVDVIEDQQDAISKLGSKIQEKILAGGSVLTLPDGKGIEITDKEYAVVRVNQADKNLIGVYTMQANIGQDIEMLMQNYSFAKSTLGVTDAFQGKYDASATSGTAKQYSINQAAGRLESKRVMKNTMYSKLYELMFKFALAYSDTKIPISTTKPNGDKVFGHFDRYKFLKVDDAGEFYWNDEFIFTTDPTSTIMMNREAMWTQIDMKLQSGAFGQLGDLDTAILYWTLMEKNGYPNAGDIKARLEERAEEQRNMAKAQAGGGAQDVMSIM